MSNVVSGLLLSQKNAPVVAVAATAPFTVASAGTTETLISLAIGMASVLAARHVSEQRESKKRSTKAGRKTGWSLTGVALLIAGPIIYDRQLSFSMAAFTGLGAGFATMILLEVISALFVGAVRGGIGGLNDFMSDTTVKHPLSTLKPSDDVPDDQQDLLGKLGDVPGIKPKDES